MNERIAELLAKLDIDLYTDKGVMMTKILVSPKDLRQFAELIVKECAHRAEAYAYMSPNFTALSEELRRMIGVEE